jgi:CheY-like chemotaxis protein
MLVEDDSDAVFLMKRAAALVPMPIRVVSMWSAEQAIKYLKGSWPFANRTTDPLPDVILLGLTLPGISGLDFLHWIKKDTELSRVPVVVFTQSKEAAVREQALKLGAADFHIKQPVFQRLVDAMMSVCTRFLPPAASQA